MTSLKLASYELTSRDMYVGFVITVVIMLHVVLYGALFIKLMHSSHSSSFSTIYLNKQLHILVFPNRIPYDPHTKCPC